MAQGEDLAVPGDDESAARDYELWSLLKEAFHAVERDVVAAASTAADVTDTEIAVLVRLDVAGTSLRSSALAGALGWERSRVSHLLARMESRGLVRRESGAGAVTVHLTDEGEERLGAARPAHLRAVRSRLVEPVGDDGAAELAELLRRVVAAGR
ncbi:MarR family winged helix-turn-helix transcriptional regulator [Actinomyces radicidentis]|uniref:MarR family winged helix-turn-helix transcriptional regulator n=1 Tax=Actinomyces radicidentis TaxID=111015 RepID=UPI0026E0FB5C|nr:MarR family transcriptional regulator [Actinomyces radicidentis]